MTKGHLRRVLAAFLVSVLSFGAIIINSSAASAAEDRPDIYLQVSPPTVQLGELKPGTTKTGEFLVQNIGAKEFDFKVYTAPYQVEGQDYNPVYTTDNVYTQISKWITFDIEEGHLEPNDEQKVHYTINVPDNAPDGGEYASIMVETDSGNADNATIRTVSRVGIILYSHVGGVTNACGKILEKDAPSFLTQPPIFATSLVENCGNVDLTASYTIQVYPLFSNDEIYSTEETPDERVTLPGTKRFNKISWDNAPAFGIYRVKQTIRFADKTEILEKYVVICPIWLIIIFILFIGSIIFWLVMRHRSRKD
jgi:hypothetical protein